MNDVFYCFVIYYVNDWTLLLILMLPCWFWH